LETDITESKNISLKYSNLLISIFFLSLLPFLILFIYIHPVADDYFFIDRLNNAGFISALKSVYHNWSGRFFSHAELLLFPQIFKTLDGYKIFALVSMLALFGCLYLFISEFTQRKISKKEKKLGIRGSSCVQIILDEVEVPAENMLSVENEGYKVALSTLEVGRIGIAAQANGIGAAALECSLKYAKEREQFGKTIADFQAIQFMLADMALRLEAARWLTYKAAQLKAEGKKTPLESSQAKLYASEMCMKNAWAAVQIHGGYGYVEDYIPERLFRDAKICEIYEGTSEVQRLLIANQMINAAAH